MPGYGFSGKPTGTGWGPDHIARIWTELMKRLGYDHYVAQGGDWGSPVSSAMARLAPAGLLGIHINLPAIVPPDIGVILAAGGPAPAGLSGKERAAFDAFSSAGKMGNRSYAVMMGTRPQTIGYGLTDSPVGLAAWMLGHPGLSHWTYDDSDPEKSLDEVLDDITLYWLTKSATSSARLYWEYSGRSPASFRPGEDRGDIAPRGDHGLSGRELSSPRDLGPACLSQPGLFSRGRQRRSFRGVGAAGALFRRAARGFQIASACNLVIAFISRTGDIAISAPSQSAIEDQQDEHHRQSGRRADQPCALQPRGHRREGREEDPRTRQAGRPIRNFPETVVPYYPYFAFVQPPFAMAKEHLRLIEQSVTVPSAETRAIGEAAKEANMVVSIGVNERDGGTIYNTQLLFDADGTLIQRRRKIMPTYHERMVWGQGDGSGLRAVDSAVGRIGQLACWEHYLPLARYALIADGEQIHAAMYPGRLRRPSVRRTDGGQHPSARPGVRPASWSTPPPGSTPTSRRRSPRTPAAPSARSPAASSPLSSIPRAAHRRAAQGRRRRSDRRSRFRPDRPAQAPDGFARPLQPPGTAQPADRPHARAARP